VQSIQICLGRLVSCLESDLLCLKLDFAVSSMWNKLSDIISRSVTSPVTLRLCDIDVSGLLFLINNCCISSIDSEKQDTQHATITK